MKLRIDKRYASLLPPLTTEEKEALRADLKANGQVQNAICDEDGVIIDGMHRFEILGDKCRAKVAKGLSDEEKIGLAISLNFNRRNLSPEQKRELRKNQINLAKQWRKDNPKYWTQKRIAETFRVSRELVKSWDLGNINSGKIAKANTTTVINANVKVPAKHHAEIARRVDGGETTVQVAADLGITQGRVSQIVKSQKKKASVETSAAATKQTNDGAIVVTSLDELDGKTFKTIYADPPWRYGNQGTRGATDNHYETMTVDEIAEMPVSDLAADNAHLHLWTTNAFLFYAEEIIEAWGFEYCSCYVWVKPQMGLGNFWRVSHEYLLFAVRGDCPFRSQSLISWGQFDRGQHSAKPEEIRNLVETASPGPYLELFGRKRVAGWTVFGNQVKG